MVPSVLPIFGASSLQIAASPFGTFDLSSSATGNTSASVTVTAAGGSGPYSYSWSQATNEFVCAANSPSSATTTFNFNIPSLGSFSTTMVCTVTDSLGFTGSVSILVTVVRI